MDLPGFQLLERQRRLPGERVENRGLYIVGYARLVTKTDVKSPEDLAVAYVIG